MAILTNSTFNNANNTNGQFSSSIALSDALKKQADAKALKLQQDAEAQKSQEAEARGIKDSLSAGFAKAPEAAPQMNAALVGKTKLAPTAQSVAAQINTDPQNQYRGLEMGLANQLQAQSLGQGPSLAQSQLQQGTDRNLAQALAMQASMRGQTAGQGARQLAQQTSAINSQASRDAATLRMQEQMQAQQQLAGVVGQGRSTDIGLATNQAGLTQQTNLANTAAQNASILQQGQMNQATAMANQQANQQANQTNLQAVLQNSTMNNDMKKFYLTSQMGMTDAEANRALGYAGQAVQAQAAKDQVKQQEYATNVGIFNSILGGAGAMGAAYVSAPAAVAPAAVASDERVKKNIKDGDKPLKDFLGALKAHQYEYKDKMDGEGTYVSPMAQELEKTELGKDMVMNMPDGKKMVNYGRAAGTLLGTAAMQERRISELEKALKARKG